MRIILKYLQFAFSTSKDLLRYHFLKFNHRFPKVLTIEETIDLILTHKGSISRFGDGEFSLMSNKSIGFQECDIRLAEKLKHVLINSSSSSCLVCIPGTLYSFKGMSFRSTIMWMHLIANSYREYNLLIDLNKVYPNSLVTRPYMDILNKNLSAKIFNKFKKIWNDRKVLIVEGENSRLGIGNDLFSNTRSLSRIITLEKNAFSKYDELYNTIQTYGVGYLILLALGPTATVLSYELSFKGFEILDIGHIDIEYEWYLKNAVKKVAIEGKFVNELTEGQNPINYNDETYESQIIHKVL